MGEIIGGSYRLVRKIGQGSFGKIYSAVDIHTNKNVAVKMESVDSRVPQILFESRIYKIMSGSTNVPRMYLHTCDGTHNMLVMDLLGKSLEDLLESCGRKLDLKTVLMLIDQMITAVEFFHKKNYIHRDIKPDNFVMGTGNESNKLYIIDYGLCKKYRDQNTHLHCPYSDGKSLTGTARYASINALSGVEQSRRDDMEGLAYVFIYLLKGSLPWMGVNGCTRSRKYEKILEKKRMVSPAELCCGLPPEFEEYLAKVKRLRFTEEPNYSEYKEMFRNLFIKRKFIFDYKFSWSHSFSDVHSHSNKCDGSPLVIRYDPAKRRRKLKMMDNDFYRSNDACASEDKRSEEMLVSGEFDCKEFHVDDIVHDDEEIDDNFVPVKLFKPKRKLPLPPQDLFADDTKESSGKEDKSAKRKKKLVRRKVTKKNDNRAQTIDDAEPDFLIPHSPHAKPVVHYSGGNIRKYAKPLLTYDGTTEKIENPILTAIFGPEAAKIKKKKNKSDEEELEQYKKEEEKEPKKKKIKKKVTVPTKKETVPNDDSRRHHRHHHVHHHHHHHHHYRDYDYSDGKKRSGHKTNDDESMHFVVKDGKFKRK